MKRFILVALFCVSAAGRAAYAQQVELLESDPLDDKSDSSGKKTGNKDGMPQIIVPVSGDEWQENVPSAAGKVQPAVKKEETKPAAKKKSKAKAAALKAAAAPKTSSAPVKPVEVVEFPAKFEMQPAASTAAAPSAAKPASAAKTAAPASSVPARPAAAKPAAARKRAAARPSTPVPAPEPAAGNGGFSVEKKHTVGDGDTLWDLSNKYYKDPYKWGKIYNANLSVLSNPDRLYPKEELVIPEMTEEVRPTIKKERGITGGDTVTERDLSVTAAAQPEKAAKPAQAVITMSDEMKAFDRSDLSEEMPVDQKVWSSYTKVVPDSWHEDGVVSSRAKTGEDSVDEGLAVNGEAIIITMAPSVSVGPGDFLSVYMKGAPSFDERGRRVGKEIQPVGIVEVVSVAGGKVRAMVKDTSNIITKGMVVKVSIRR